MRVSRQCRFGWLVPQELAGGRRAGAWVGVLRSAGRVVGVHLRLQVVGGCDAVDQLELVSR